MKVTVNEGCECVLMNGLFSGTGNLLTSMVCGNEGYDSEGGGDEGVASVEYHDGLLSMATLYSQVLY